MGEIVVVMLGVDVGMSEAGSTLLVGNGGVQIIVVMAVGADGNATTPFVWLNLADGFACAIKLT